MNLLYLSTFTPTEMSIKRYLLSPVETGLSPGSGIRSHEHPPAYAGRRPRTGQGCPLNSMFERVGLTKIRWNSIIDWSNIIL